MTAALDYSTAAPPAPAPDSRWHRFWFEPERPDNLGLCRVLFYGLLLVYYAPIDYAGWGAVPKGFYDPIWLFQRLHLHVLPDPYMGQLAALWKASLLLSFVGFVTRVSTVVAFVLGVYLIGVPYNFGKTDHMTALVVFVLGIMALSWSGDAWSIDALFRRKRGAAPPPPSGEYRWPVRAVWVAMSVVFFAAGMAKLMQGGLAWVTSEHFQISLVQRFYDPNPPTVRLGLWLAAHPLLARTFAGVSLLGELLFPLALVSRRARAVLPPLLLAMQLGIGLLMNVWFYTFMFVYVFWVRWDRLLSPRLKSAQPTPAP